MKFFIDTANVEEIRKANEMGIICGVTTNPSLIAKEGRDFKEVIKEEFSLPKDKIPTIAARKLGFSSAGAKICDVINNVIRSAVGWLQLYFS